MPSSPTEHAFTLALIIILALLCLSLTATVGEPATYHVSIQGADTNPGTQAQPWRTITKATQVAQAGDTVQIGPGTFAERLSFANSGTASAPITYVGTRSGDTWQTVIDGTQPVTATWTAAGNGIYTASLGYNPMVLSAGNRFVWRCGDHAMQSGACQTRLAHSATQTCNMSIGQGPCWDGVEALYGVQNGVTHLRFRNGDNPSTKSVRAGPNGGTVVVNGKHYITLRDLKIVGGGERTVDLKGGSQGTVLDGCYIAAPMWRVHLEGNVRDTLITRSTLTMDGIGLVTHTPGDWSSESPARIVNRWLYDTGKFLIGNTQTHDASILMVSATNTTITHNVMKNANAGITFYNTTSNTTIAHNQIYQHADNGVYIDSDNSTGVLFHHNLLYDNDHGMRFNSTHRPMDWRVYANRYWGATAEGKNIFIAGPGSPPSGSRIEFYHNSCAGGGWCLDVGSDGAQVNLSFVHARNLMHSARGLSSWGGVQWGTMQNVYNDSTTWKGKPLGDFVLPAGHPALDSAPTLTLPGMDAAYYVDGKADHGAVQAGVTDGGGNGGGPPPPVGDTTPPTVSITAPTQGAIVSGVVAVTASASDNVGIAGVLFYVNGEPRGSEQCCSSVGHSAVDTTRVQNGQYVITAEARDSSGNRSMSAPIEVTVYNGPTPPEPPEPEPGPEPGPHPVLVCEGDILAGGKLSLRCTPQSSDTP